MLALAAVAGTAGAKSVNRPAAMNSLRDKTSEEAVIRQLRQERQETVFIENNGQVKNQHGQARKDIDFQVKGQGINVFLGDAAIRYQWIGMEKMRMA